MDPDSILKIAQDTGLYALLHTKYGWPLTETVHFLSICVLFASVGLVDLRILGVMRQVPIAAISRIVLFGVGAFAVNVVTGVMFFINAPDQYMYNPAFQLKVLTMMVAGLNVLAFYGLFARRTHATPAGGDAPAPAKAVAAISLLAWMTVIVFGRLITYFRPPYHWCFWC